MHDGGCVSSTGEIETVAKPSQEHVVDTSPVQLVDAICKASDETAAWKSAQTAIKELGLRMGDLQRDIDEMKEKAKSFQSRSLPSLSVQTDFEESEIAQIKVDVAEAMRTARNAMHIVQSAGNRWVSGRGGASTSTDCPTVIR